MDFYLVEWKIILTFTAIFEKLRYRLATSERLSNNYCCPIKIGFD